jgi:hypothetical protein
MSRTVLIRSTICPALAVLYNPGSVESMAEESPTFSMTRFHIATYLAYVSCGYDFEFGHSRGVQEINRDVVPVSFAQPNSN